MDNERWERDEDVNSKFLQRRNKGQNKNNEYESIKLYALVLFPDDEGPPKSIDMIPRHWIPKPENPQDDLYCYYTPNHNNEKAKAKFREMIKFCEPFDKSWPLYRIEIRGSADSFAEAEAKLEKLVNHSYAYSTESESSAKKMAQKDTNKFKQRVVKSSLTTVVEELGKAKKDLHESISSDGTVDDQGVEDSSLSFQDRKDDGESSGSKEDSSPVVPLRERNTIILRDDSSSDPEDKRVRENQLKIERAQRREKLLKLARKKSKTVSDKTSKPHSSLENTDLLPARFTVKINSKSKSQHKPKNFKLQTPSKADTSKKPFVWRNPIVFPPQKPSSDKTSTGVANGNWRDPSTVTNGKIVVEDGARKSSKTDVNGSTDVDLLVQSGKSDSKIDGIIDDSNNEMSLHDLITKIHVSLSVQIGRVKGEVVGLKNLFINSQTKNRSTNVDLQSDVEDDKLELPCQTYSNFKDFNTKLQMDKEYRTKIKLRIKNNIVKKEAPSKNLTEIVKCFISRQVGMKYTAVKKTHDKQLFKETYFYKVLEGVFMGSREDVTTEKEFGAYMGRVFNNVKDWEGHRLLRQQKAKRDKENVRVVDETSQDRELEDDQSHHEAPIIDSEQQKD